MTEPSAPKPNRTWLYVGLAFVAFWVGYLALFGPRGGPRLDGTGLTEPAEYGWRLTDLKGTPVEFARYKGKTVFLNIWATWCGPCVGEMPSIARLAAEPRLKDVAFVCVSVDDATADVTRFLDGKDWPLTVLHATDTPPVFTTSGIPATFLIAPDGRIASAKLGAATWDEPSVVAFLESLSQSGK